MFPDCAKLYIAPISESQCYDERYLFLFSDISVTHKYNMTGDVALSVHFRPYAVLFAFVNREDLYFCC